ncbi:hypothetical protein CRG98_012726 [Punica granatum]|uniref:Auxin-responsive protein SAUR71-like n=1 Tax=Punica granatum TaxID=22663 RepID=A0A2I0KF06_PUNGR|nr:hypothetical protein CRG98_012726 [Punica granatum]
MDILKEKWRKNLFPKTWESWRRPQNREKLPSSLPTKGKSLSCASNGPTEHDKQKNKFQAPPPRGCFSVYVGPDKQRFAIKKEFANHPLFKMLLEDAESEYGYKSQGPISLPCDVNLFYRVLAEMDSSDDINPPGCSSLVKCYCSPGRRSHSTGKVHGVFKLVRYV